MRIVIAPLISFRNVQSESNYLWYIHLLERWLADHDDLYVHMIVPEASRPHVLQMDRLNYIYEPGGGVEVYYDTQVSLPVTLLQLFNPRMGRYIVDVLLTSRTAATNTWARMLWDYRMPRNPIPVVIVEPKVASAHGSHQVIRHIELMTRTLGYASSYPIFISPEERSQAMSTAAQYCVGSVLGEIEKRSIVIPGWIKTEQLDRIKAQTPKREKFTAFFGGRLNTLSKRADKMFEILDAFFATGRPMDTIVCSPKDDHVFYERYIQGRYDHVEFHTRVPREEFLRMACSSHVYLNTSLYEGFTVGFAEQLYAGLVSIVPDKPWVRAMLLERAESYPFMYRTWEQAAGMLRYVYDKYDEACEQVAWVPEWLKGRYNEHLVGKMYDARIRELVAEHEPCTRGLLGKNIMALFREALAEMKDRESPVFTLGDFWRAVGRIADCPLENDSRWGRPTRWVAYRWLQQLGLRDTCRTEEPAFTLVRDAMTEPAGASSTVAT